MVAGNAQEEDVLFKFISAMVLKLALLLKNNRNLLVVIFAISLTFLVLLPLILERRAVSRTKGKSLNLNVYDVYNAVRVSLGAYQQSPASSQGDNVSVVPNVVHYVWLSDDLTFSFINYLSFKSVDRFIQPQFLYVYGEVVPTGPWWYRAISEIGNMYHVRVDAPEFAPNGQRFKYMAHKSDFLRFNLLKSELKLSTFTKFCLM